MLTLDFGFLTPAVVSSYVLKGFVFSLQLTAIASSRSRASGSARRRVWGDAQRPARRVLPAGAA